MAIEITSLIFYFLIAFTFLLVHYLFFLSRIIRGLNNLKPPSKEVLTHELISVIIPFRNEEENILANLKSIEEQNYPSDKFEVIYVNDSSEDDSLKLLEKNISRENIKLLTIPGDYSTNAHKKRAVRYGIENSNGQIIVTTDADCIHHPRWLFSLLQSFDNVTGFISGAVEFYSGENLFSKFQQLEFTGLVLCGAGLIGSGHPTICNAANIAYRKKVFDEVGGFKDQMNLSSGDDELLMQKIAKDSDYKVRFCIDQDAIVKTNSNKTISDFFQQRKRWASKGLFYNNKTLVIKLILIYLFYLGIIAQLFLSFIHQIFILSLLLSVSIKFLFELIILKKGKNIIFEKLELKYFLLAEFLQIPYIIFIGIFGAFGNYLWKSRRIKR